LEPLVQAGLAGISRRTWQDIQILARGISWSHYSPSASAGKGIRADQPDSPRPFLLCSRYGDRSSGCSHPPLMRAALEVTSLLLRDPRATSAGPLGWQGRGPPETGRPFRAHPAPKGRAHRFLPPNADLLRFWVPAGRHDRPPPPLGDREERRGGYRVIPRSSDVK